MFNKFYTKQELMEMPLVVLRGLDIETTEQQNLVQEVVNIKLAGLPPARQLFRQIIPDINSPEEEAEWQAKIDAKRKEWESGLRPVPTPDIQPEIQEETVINPPGVYIPQETELAQEEVIEPVVDPAVKCQICGSKSYRHKTGCATLSK